jgi:hypothetical protein
MRSRHVVTCGKRRISVLSPLFELADREFKEIATPLPI